MILLVFSAIFFPPSYLVVVLVVDNLRDVLLGVETLGSLEGFHNILYGVVVDTTPGGYITNFYNIEVDVNYGIAYIGGFW